MGAATWTRHAIDITEDGPAEWGKYLTVQQLSDAIGLSPKTILDTLPRNPPLDIDPQVAIYRPAARTGGGQSGLGATPLWTAEQRDRYIELKQERDEYNRTQRRRKRRGGEAGLPVYNIAEAAEKGLASLPELADITGYAENSLRRYDRQHGDFPAEVGIADRVPPNQMGPPRYLYSIDAVRAFLTRHSKTEADDIETGDTEEGDSGGTPTAA